MTEERKRDGKNVYISARAYRTLRKQAKLEGITFKLLIDNIAKDVGKGAA